MRVLADANMQETVVDLLREGGHDVVWVKEVQPRTVDPDVLAWATRESRLLITYDKDFGEITQRQQQAAPHGVALFRVNDDVLPDEAVKLIARNVTTDVEWPGYLWVITIRKRLAMGQPDAA